MSGRWEALIKAKFDVVQVAGDEMIARCPWHRDSGRPNLYVNMKSGLYICFACHAKGHMKTLGRSVVTTQHIKDRLLPKPQTRQSIYPESWLKQFPVGHPDWDARGFRPETIKRFELGYDPMSDRLTIPLRDEFGRILGVTYRRRDDIKPKYKDPTGFHKNSNLYGSWLVTGPMIALVEGPADAIAMWDAGIEALAMYGSAITDDQVRLLHRLMIREVVVVTDADSAGRLAIDQIHNQLRMKAPGIKTRYRKKRSYRNEGKDPAEISHSTKWTLMTEAVAYSEWLSTLVSVHTGT